MKLPTVNQEPCPPGPTDGDVQSMLIKPALAIVCQSHGDQQFKAFLTTDNDGETELVSSVTWTSSNSGIVSINASTGLATLVGPGIATLTATYGGFTAYAQVEVIADSECCEPLVMGELVMIDQSRSMSESSGGMTRLAFAKALAKAFYVRVRWDKDVAGLMRFHSSGVAVQGPSSTAITNAQVDSIAQTTRQTDFLQSLTDGIAVLDAMALDRKILIILSDGENRPEANGSVPSPADVLAVADEFKSRDGIIVCIGCAATGDGFALLQALATGGFFVNAWTAEQIAEALDILPRFLCYFCGGQPPVYGYCLSEPVPEQAPDPTALDDQEITT